MGIWIKIMFRIMVKRKRQNRFHNHKNSLLNSESIASILSACQSEFYDQESRPRLKSNVWNLIMVWRIYVRTDLKIDINVLFIMYNLMCYVFETSFIRLKWIYSNICGYTQLKEMVMQWNHRIWFVSLHQHVVFN